MPVDFDGPADAAGKKDFSEMLCVFLVLSELICARALHLACILGNTFCGMKNRL